jgi:hypothetical protein
MSTKRELYRDAKAALQEADQLESGVGRLRAQVSAARWRATRDIVKLRELGETQRAIGQGVGLGHATVGRYLQVWDRFGSVRSQTDFGECLKELRGGDWGHDHVSSAKRTELVAKYLKDREVWKAPEVKAAIRSNVHKDGREAGTTVFTAAPVTRIEPGDWRWLLAQMRNCEDAIRDGMTKIRRGGMPARHAGELIKQSRRLVAAAGKLEEQLSETAVGKPA